MDLLLNVSRHGGQAWSDRIGVVLNPIRTLALDAIWRSERLISLREEFRTRLKLASCPAGVFDVVDEQRPGPGSVACVKMFLGGTCALYNNAIHYVLAEDDRNAHDLSRSYPCAVVFCPIDAYRRSDR